MGTFSNARPLAPVSLRIVGLSFVVDKSWALRVRRIQMIIHRKSESG
jgi:hypothetical protein